MTFCKSDFTFWPAERYDPGRIHRLRNAAGFSAGGC